MAYYVGNHRLVQELAICGPNVEEILQRLEREGKTTVVLATQREPLCVLGVADTGQATLWMAVFADMGASLIVVFNGLRLLRAPGRAAEDGRTMSDCTASLQRIHSRP